MVQALLALFVFALLAASVSAAEEVETAPVTLDGRILFRVRGLPALPAQARATAIQIRIAVLAADAQIAQESVTSAAAERATEVIAGPTVILTVSDADAALEGVDRNTLALAEATRIRRAIADYRQDRDPLRLRGSALKATFVSVAFGLSLWMILFISRRVSVATRARYGPRVRSISVQSFDLVKTQHIWSLLDGSLRLVRGSCIIVLFYLYFVIVLGQFPWTRQAANQLHDMLASPLMGILRGLFAQTPNLVCLMIIFVVVRYVLRLLKLFADAVSSGTVALPGFERSWAPHTLKLARAIVIIFAAVAAYPYVPGSGSEAFKGLSIFLGVLVSLGSSSFLSNLIAGYSLIYRRAFKAGDRVEIGGIVGDVMEQRLQVTHIRSLKNEEVIIPNSVILSGEVTNYSAMAGTLGLILHLTVGIGYEVPWRQVEAILLEAAARTPGVMQQPTPFVLTLKLGDFAVTYELNAYCSDAQSAPALYSALHGEVLDRFNEYGIQIMTPAYKTDPDVPKVVPKERWFAAPAASSRP